MGLVETLWWGLFGGAVGEFLGVYALRREKRENFPEWIQSKLYWGISITMVVVGGILAVAYLRSNVALNALLAINIEASAPLAVSNFTRQLPTISPGDKIN